MRYVVYFIRSTMTNEGFKEYVNGNMLFWAANVKTTEGYRGIHAHCNVLRIKNNLIVKFEVNVKLN